MLRRHITPIERNSIAQKQDYKCNTCHQLLPVVYEIDHVHELCDGGEDNHDNLQALCPNCHRSKTQFESSRRTYDRYRRIQESLNKKEENLNKRERELDEREEKLLKRERMLIENNEPVIYKTDGPYTSSHENPTTMVKELKYLHSVKSLVQEWLNIIAPLERLHGSNWRNTAAVGEKEMRRMNHLINEKYLPW